MFLVETGNILDLCRYMHHVSSFILPRGVCETELREMNLHMQIVFRPWQSLKTTLCEPQIDVQSVWTIIHWWSNMAKEDQS